MERSDDHGSLDFWRDGANESARHDDHDVLQHSLWTRHVHLTQ